jgi:acetyl-CoA acyltransferase 1
MNRLNSISSQVAPKNKGDEAVIIMALRTPLTKAKKGGLSSCSIEDLLTPLIKEIMSRSKLDPSLITDVIVGNCLAPGSAQLSVRMAALSAGLPNTVSAMSLNRQCSSGIQAIATGVAHVQSGMSDFVIAGGAESMSLYTMGSLADIERVSEEVLKHKEASDTLIPMGLTSENVASKFKIPRNVQDKFAQTSHAKAAHAQKSGFFKEEIVPIKVKGGKMIDSDDGIRVETTFESLSKLQPAFKIGGTTTAGNSSQTTDGAALALITRRSLAEKYGLKIQARLSGFAVAGCPPDIMGIGPAVAIPKVLGSLGLGISDIDIYEINEAFASQAVYCVQKLGIPVDRVNPQGGAIALGHPLGCTGARLLATLIPELKRNGKKRGVISMCIGGGMGAAAVIELE